MPLSWNEIRGRALAFAKEWADETSEDAEAKSFWDGFFNIFGVTRRRVASFETPVKKGEGQGGYIDLLWKGVLLVEHKSRGKDLDRALHQALDRTVDQAYGRKSFAAEAERVAFLFTRYQHLLAAAPTTPGRKPQLAADRD